MPSQAASRQPQPAHPAVYVLIPAYNEAARIGLTVQAALSLTLVELVVVVDDGSSDATSQVARQAGAVVVRHGRNLGKAAALQTAAQVVAMQQGPNQPPGLLLLLDADLQASAAQAEVLIKPVVSGQADLTVAVLPRPAGAGGFGLVLGLARWGIKAATGFVARAPLSGQRCLSQAAFNQALPLAKGWGVEVGMTIDLLRQHLTVQEVPCQLGHRVSTNTLRGGLHRLAQLKDVATALVKRWRAIVGRRPIGN